MSLPIPSTTTTNNNNTSSHNNIDPEMERFYIALIQKSHGDLRYLLSSFFSFLHRRTDLYCVSDIDLNNKNNNKKNNMGFKEGDAEKIIIAAFRQFPLRRISSSSSSSIPSPVSSTASTTVVKQQQSTSSLQLPPSSSQDPTAPQTESKTTNSTTVTTTSEISKSNKPRSTMTENVEQQIQYTKDGLQIPIGNGGITKQYRWTQTIDECTILVDCSNKISNRSTLLRGKDLRVTILPNSLHVQIIIQQQDHIKTNHKVNAVAETSSSSSSSSDNEFIIVLDGELVQRIVPSESTWTIESGVLQLILYKHIKTFWDSIFINDTIKIDTSLVDSRRNIDTYDEITQAHIRKIIYQQSSSLQQDDTIMTSIDGSKPIIPSVLPNGVEYIDQEILDAKMKELGK